MAIRLKINNEKNLEISFSKKKTLQDSKNKKNVINAKKYWNIILFNQQVQDLND